MSELVNIWNRVKGKLATIRKVLGLRELFTTLSILHWTINYQRIVLRQPSQPSIFHIIWDLVSPVHKYLMIIDWYIHWYFTKLLYFLNMGLYFYCISKVFMQFICSVMYFMLDYKISLQRIIFKLKTISFQVKIKFKKYFRLVRLDCLFSKTVSCVMW